MQSQLSRNRVVERKTFSILRASQFAKRCFSFIEESAPSSLLLMKACLSSRRDVFLRTLFVFRLLNDEEMEAFASTPGSHSSSIHKLSLTLFHSIFFIFSFLIFSLLERQQHQREKRKRKWKKAVFSTHYERAISRHDRWKGNRKE